jgi:hypothetical protein
MSICATAAEKLPADVTINRGAGRGSFLVVRVRVSSEEELSFIVDTGSSVTLLDDSLAPKLGKRLGRLSMQSWGKMTELPTYAAPPLYLGGVRLLTGPTIATRAAPFSFWPLYARVSLRACLRRRLA